MFRRLFTAGLLLAALIFPAALTTRAADEPKKDDKDGWVQLFNGKDLTGWKTHPDDKGATWEVKDGILTGSGPVSHLFTEKDDYENFIFRVEARINDKGNSGQYFHAKFMKSFPEGYECQINSTHSDPIKTGSLYPDGRNKFSEEMKKKIIIKEQLHKPDEWFTQEVTVEGNHYIIKVNGKVTVDVVDENPFRTKGCFALQQHNQGSVVEFRKIEYKPLPASKPEKDKN